MSTRDLYTLRPIVQWPGEMTKQRRMSPFYADWWRTQEFLERELEALRARNVVLQIAVTELDFKVNGELRAHAKPSHPGVILAFESKYGPLQYACDTFFDWEDNVRAVALSLEALRKMERYGVTRRGQQYTGWKALPGPMTRQEAEDLMRSYGGEAEALRRTHPDHGGDRAAFDRVMEARRLLKGAS